MVIKNLTKELGKKIVLDNISAEFCGGKIYGLVGKNGSGKTMLLRTICGLLKPSSGEIIFHNNPAFGITIENISLYPEFTGLHNLKILANIRKTATEKDLTEILQKVGLNPHEPKKVKKYSLGMRQRLALAQAFMEKPDIILLDEPFNALDEDGVVLIKNLCKEEIERGAIIVISSHNREYITSLSDEILFMENGRLSKL
jgi:ABC-2 type transport system ATP-binding protein